MVSGTLTVVLWKSVFGFSDYLYELVPGFVIALFLVLVVSVLTKTEQVPDLAA